MTDLCTTQEIADRLRVAPATVTLWARQGLIPSIKISAKTIRFDEAEVIAALVEIGYRRKAAKMP